MIVPDEQMLHDHEGGPRCCDPGCPGWKGSMIRQFDQDVLTDRSYDLVRQRAVAAARAGGL